MRRGARVAALLAGLAFWLVGSSGAMAQSTDDLRRTIQDMKKVLETQEQRLQQLEGEQRQVQQQQQEQKAAAAVMQQALEAQPAQAVLGTAPMPPSLAGLGIFASVDFKFVRFTGVEVMYAGSQFVPAGAGTLAGDLATVSPDREFAPRFTAGVYLPGGWGIISANWMSVAADGDDSISSPGNITGPFPPPCCGGSTVDRATAVNRVTLDQFDIQFQYPIQVTRSLVLTPEAGIRAVWWTQNVRSDFFNADGTHFGKIGDRARSHGVGPKIGLGASWEVLPGLKLAANASGGYLVGSTTSSFRFCRDANFGFPGDCDRRFSSREDVNNGFPFVDAEFAISYSFGANTPVRGLTIAAGYQVGTFFNLTAHSTIVNGGTDLVVVQKRDVTHDAPFFKLQYLF